MGLGRKQHADNAQFVATWQRIGEVISRAHIDRLLEQTLTEVRRVTAGKRVAYAWSGGKDSQALRALMDAAGIPDCVLAISQLEYPAFLQWVTDEMPHELEVICSHHDLDWLAAHPKMLFPQDSRTAARWFREVQHAAQTRYFKAHQLDMLILGRRHADGNYTGADGTGVYTNRAGVTRFCPIRRWSHEEVLAVCYHLGYPLPPIYDWPNGFIVGTGAWAARQWTGSVAAGWREVYAIDSAIVEQAATVLPSARAFLETL